MSEEGDELGGTGRLLFGAGFVFGVMFTMLILAVVTATVATEQAEGLLASEVIITIVAGMVFAGIVGVSLYLLAFPENRIEVPVEMLFGDDEEEEAATEEL